MYHNIYKSTTGTPHHHLPSSIVEHSAPNLLNSWTTAGCVIWTWCSAISSIFLPNHSLILSDCCSLYSLYCFIKVTNCSNLLMDSTCSGIPVAILVRSDCCVVTMLFNSSSKVGRVETWIQAKGWSGCVSMTYLNHLNDETFLQYISISRILCYSLVNCQYFYLEMFQYWYWWWL